MRMLKASEKERFLQILGQAEYELLDGVNIPGIKRTFGQVERDTIKGVCTYIEKMIEYCDRRGMLVKEEYEVKTETNNCEDCFIAQNTNLEDDDSPCRDCEAGE